MQGNAEPVSLFVVHWNRPHECAGTVRALLEQSVPLRVTVIDNHSAADAVQALRSTIDPGIEVMQLPENKGWGPALNVALRHWLQSGRNSYCLISAHDAVPSAGCVALLREAMEKDPRLGIACPQYPDASIPHFTSVRGVQLRQGMPRERGVAQSVDVPHGTLMMLRRECLAQIGLFDERYFAYGDEHELGARAVRHGWRVALVWGALVTNPGTATPSAWRSYLFARNSLLLVHDYFGSAAAILRALLISMNTVRLALARESDFAFSARARFEAVRDYFAGRFGPPRFS
ncbi:MAG TPA: glycosyltransferase [Chthoniobacterales bacterium]|jgi:GT2 family glycosyltransferase